MRKITTLILLLVFLFISEGSFLYFKYLQTKIRSDVKEQIHNNLSENSLKIIVLSQENQQEINWTKKDSEFEYHGKRYDIVKIENKENKKYLYCIEDIAEQHLISTYIKQQKRQNNKILLLQKLLENKYFPAEIYTFQFSETFKVLYFNNLFNIISQNFEPVSPPPKRFF